MFDIWVNLSMTPVRCEECGKLIKTGGRVVSNDNHNFDTCECERKYDD